MGRGLIGTGIPPRHLTHCHLLSYGRGQLYDRRRSRQGRPTRGRGSLKAFGAGLGCLRLRGIASAEFLHADSSAAQPASETLQNRRAIVRFGVFFNGMEGGRWPHSGGAGLTGLRGDQSTLDIAASDLMVERRLRDLQLSSETYITLYQVKYYAIYIGNR